MITLIGLLLAALFGVVVVFGIGATIYEVYIAKKDPLTDRDYTRSYDWTHRDH